MCITTLSMRPKGAQAARLRQRKFALLRRLTIPPEGLPGSLALTHRRCGKPTCHCATGDGHPLWSLTFMVKGKKRVERIPEEWLAQVRRRVAEGYAFKAGITEVFALNALLLVIERKQRGK